MGCSVCGAEKIEARGLCENHYHRWWMIQRGKQIDTSWPDGEPPAELVRTPRGKHETCTVIEDGVKCDRPHKAKGMCHKHYLQQNRVRLTCKLCDQPRRIGEYCRHHHRQVQAGEPITPTTYRRGVYESCTVVENGVKCEEPHKAKGMCRKHYGRACRRNHK